VTSVTHRREKVPTAVTLLHCSSEESNSPAHAEVETRDTLGVLATFADQMLARVSTQVHLVANDGPACSARVSLPAAPARLFD
jgi:hypothetical protein